MKADGTWGHSDSFLASIGGAPPETLPNFNYDVLEEVCGH